MEQVYLFAMHKKFRPQKIKKTEKKVFLGVFGQNTPAICWKNESIKSTNFLGNLIFKPVFLDTKKTVWTIFSVV